VLDRGDRAVHRLFDGADEVLRPVSSTGFMNSRAGTGLYWRTSIGPRSDAAASRASRSASGSRTFAAYPRAVTPASASSAAS
jgi:hypothetical protein